MTPRISIVVSSYRRPKLVRDTIESALEQDYDTWEMVVADDDSGDETLDAIRDAARGDERVVVLPQAAGASPVRDGMPRYCYTIDAALRVARGDLVCYICDDDYLAPGSLRRRVDAFDAHPEVDVVVSKIMSISYDAVSVWDSSAPPESGRVKLVTASPCYWREGAMGPLGGHADHNQVTHRRSCLDRMGGPPWWKAVRNEPGDATFFKRLDALGVTAIGVDFVGAVKRYHACSFGRLEVGDGRRE